MRIVHVGSRFAKGQLSFAAFTPGTSRSDGLLSIPAQQETLFPLSIRDSHNIIRRNAERFQALSGQRAGLRHFVFQPRFGEAVALFTARLFHANPLLRSHDGPSVVAFGAVDGDDEVAIEVQ